MSNNLPLDFNFVSILNLNCILLGVSRFNIYKIDFIFLQSTLDKKCKVCYTKNAKQTIQANADFSLKNQAKICVCVLGLTEIGIEGRRCALKTRIQELRKERRISQEELALAVGVTRQTITSLECEKYTASLVLAYKIAKYFGMTIEEVFLFDDTV